MNKEVAKVIVSLAPVAFIATLGGIGIVSQKIDQTKTIKQLREDLIQERMRSSMNFVRDQYVFDKQFETIVTEFDN